MPSQKSGLSSKAILRIGKLGNLRSRTVLTAGGISERKKKAYDRRQRIIEQASLQDRQRILKMDETAGDPAFSTTAPGEEGMYFSHEGGDFNLGNGDPVEDSDAEEDELCTAFDIEAK